MKTRTHTSIQSRKSKINPHVWIVFVMIIAPIFGLSLSMSYWGIWFITGTSLFLLILAIYKYFSNKKKTHNFYYTSTKAYDVSTTQNAMNHNNYYKDIKLTKAIQKKLWKEIYYDKYIGNLWLITFLLTIYFALALWFWENYFQQFSDTVILIMFFFIPVWLLIWWHIYNKNKYQRIIKNPQNRYIFENFLWKKFFFVKQRNNIGWEDLIFWKR
jgi:hypothetical protein